jgi:hypothetical protein
LNNKIEKTKKISAVFLATVLIAGTIALSFPFFMITGTAQAQPYYGMDSYNDRKSYGMDDSYGASDYGMDKKPYAMDSYEPEYPSSYKPDYKPQYPSYDKKDERQIQR